MHYITASEDSNHYRANDVECYRSGSSMVQMYQMRYLKDFGSSSTLPSRLFPIRSFQNSLPTSFALRNVKMSILATCKIDDECQPVKQTKRITKEHAKVVHSLRMDQIEKHRSRISDRLKRVTYMHTKRTLEEMTRRRRLQ